MSWEASRQRRIEALTARIELLELAWMIKTQTENECDGNETPGIACNAPGCICKREIEMYIEIAKGRTP